MNLPLCTRPTRRKGDKLWLGRRCDIAVENPGEDDYYYFILFFPTLFSLGKGRNMAILEPTIFFRPFGHMVQAQAGKNNTFYLKKHQRMQQEKKSKIKSDPVKGSYKPNHADLWDRGSILVRVYAPVPCTTESMRLPITLGTASDIAVVPSRSPIAPPIRALSGRARSRRRRACPSKALGSYQQARGQGVTCKIRVNVLRTSPGSTGNIQARGQGGAGKPGVKE